MTDVEDGPAPPSFEAEYSLEFPLRCPHCKDTIQRLQALRLARARVNFISLLPPSDASGLQAPCSWSLPELSSAFVSPVSVSCTTKHGAEPKWPNTFASSPVPPSVGIQSRMVVPLSSVAKPAERGPAAPVGVTIPFPT